MTINLVTYPDYDHNSEHKICLVADTPQINEILDIVEKFTESVSIHCVTKDDSDFNWIANTVNSSDFVFVSSCSLQKQMLLGWILGRSNVWHNVKDANAFNTKYESSVLTAYIKYLDQRNQ